MHDKNEVPDVLFDLYLCSNKSKALRTPKKSRYIYIDMEYNSIKIIKFMKV